MDKIFCDKKCDNINCKDKLTELYKMGNRNVITEDMSSKCGKYIKSLDPEIDNLIQRKIDD